MQQEALFALVEHVVENLLVEFCAEGTSGESLSLSTGEHCRSVRAWNVVNLAPDRTDFVGLTAVETDAFVEDAAAHGFFLHIVVVAGHERCFLVAFFFRYCLKIVFLDFLERLVAPLLVGAAGLSHGVCFFIAFVVYVFAEVFVVDLMAVFAFHGAYFLGELHLYEALSLDCFVSGFECLEKFEF